MLLAFNGIPVIHATIRMPRVGVWNADLVVDTSTDVTGGGTLATFDGSFSLIGTVRRHGVFQNTLSLRLVGGAGGLSTVLGPASYQAVTTQVVLTDILRACGETLSNASTAPQTLTTATPLPIDAATLSTQLPRWTRIGGQSGTQALKQLLAQFPASSWRMNPDGSMWVGTDSYPPPPSVPFDVVERYFGEGRIVIGSQQPFLLPGTTLTIGASATQGTQKVSNVIHMVTPDTVRAEVWFETP